jgi:hypothetical protein
MISTIAYTFCTNNGELLQKTNKFFVELFMLSYLSAKSQENIDTIIVFADAEGCEFINKLGIDVETFQVDFNEVTYDKRYWNFPKLIVYKLLHSLQIPFLHIDMDVILTRTIIQDELNAAVLCEKYRGNNMANSFNKILPIKRPKPMSITCSGLYGGNQTELFVQLYDEAIQAVNMPDVMFIENERMHTIEETLFAQILEDKNIRATELTDAYIHYQGYLQKHNILNHKDIHEQLLQSSLSTVNVDQILAYYEATV